MKRAEALEAAKAALDRAGYEVSLRCMSRASCFDFAGRKEEKPIFLKVLSDIREVSPEDAAEIRKISECLSSASLFITDMNKEQTLRDDTVYSRYGVYVVTSKTFEDIVQGSYPLVEAAPGGYWVRMEGNKIRQRRQELGLSIGKLSGMASVSRGALYGYESDLTRASVSAAYRLEEILGVPLAKTVDIFAESPTSGRTRDPSPAGQEGVRNRFLRLILGKLARFDLRVSHIERAPFDFSAHCHEMKLRIVGGVFGKKERHARERMEEIVSLSRIVGAKPLLLGKQKRATTGDAAFLSYDELGEIQDKEELTTLL